MTAGARPTIDYSPPPRWYRRRTARRALTVVFATLLLALSLWQFGANALHRAHLVYWQHQAMNFVSNDGTVAFTMDAAERTKCLTSGGYVSQDRVEAFLIVKPWLEFCSFYGHAPEAQPIAFCHSRVSPAGHRRLVVVNVALQEYSENLPLLLIPEIFVPGTLFERPSRIMFPGDVERTPGGRTTVFMGKCDPTDASHFTIDVEPDSGPIQIFDGRLKDDDTIELNLRNSPTPQAPLSADGIQTSD